MEDGISILDDGSTNSPVASASTCTASPVASTSSYSPNPTDMDIIDIDVLLEPQEGEKDRQN